MKMTTLLIKREFWKNKYLLWLPISLVMIFMIGILGFILFDAFQYSSFGSLAYILFDSDAKGDLYFKLDYTSLLGIAIFYQIILTILLSIYFIKSNSLFSHNLESLFWYSLPINQSKNIQVKLITGFIILPFIMCIIFILTVLFLLTIGTLYAIYLDLHVWESVWKSSYSGTLIYNFICNVYIQVIMQSPFFACCYLIAMFGKRYYFSLFFMVLILLPVIEYIFYGNTIQSEDGIKEYLSDSIIGFYIGFIFSPGIFWMFNMPENYLLHADSFFQTAFEEINLLYKSRVGFIFSVYFLFYLYLSQLFFYIAYIYKKNKSLSF